MLIGLLPKSDNDFWSYDSTPWIECQCIFTFRLRVLTRINSFHSWVNVSHFQYNVDVKCQHDFINFRHNFEYYRVIPEQLNVCMYHIKGSFNQKKKSHSENTFASIYFDSNNSQMIDEQDWPSLP